MPSTAVATAKVSKLIFDSPQELQMVHAAKNGDQAAFTDLYNHHHNRIYVIIKKIVKDENLAEGMANDAMTKVWLNLSKFDEQSKFSTWVTRIAINEALMHLRREKRKNHELSFEALQEHQPKDFQQAMTHRDLNLEGVADRQVLTLAFESVPEPYQAALKLRYIDGDSVEEICHTLSFKRGKTSTVKSRLMRGRNLLKRKLVKLSTAK